jgi:leucyl aminopeptidase (aminopeptidase T)
MKNAARVILNKCMGLKSKETCLILTDNSDDKQEISELLFEEASKISEVVEEQIIAVAQVNGEEPDKFIALKMLEFDVILMLTEKSMTHTVARIEASKNGARIASMPGITKEIMKRCIDVNYDEMQELTNNICDKLDVAKKVRITTELGTDLTFSVNGRKSHGRKAGINIELGDCSNLPEAESYIAPVEGTANGVYFVDASQAGVGKVDSAIKITVKDGFAIKIEGDNQAVEFDEMLKGINDKNAYNIAELGIGTNKKAIVTGVILEDEKVYGTCHIALGNNFGFGGKVEVGVHVDGVINKPTIFFDDEKVFDSGKFL